MRIEVNGRAIDPEFIRSHAALLREREREAGCDVTLEDGIRILEEAAGFAIRMEIVKQEAERQNITVDQMFENWCKPVRAPRAKDLRDFYLKHREEFWRPSAVLVSHIVKNVDHEDERERRHSEMLAVQELLASGGDFAETANAHSDCPGGGGSLGYIHRGEMVPEFDEVVFAAEVGTITPIFSTRFGLHIALVPEVRPEGIIPFEELAERLAESFYEELKGARISEQIEQLESRANVRRASGA